MPNFSFKLTKSRTFQVFNPSNHGYLGVVRETTEGWEYYLRGSEQGFANGVRDTQESAAGELYDLVTASMRLMQEQVKGV